MIRRDPTRIELTLEDIQEYVQTRRDADSHKRSKTSKINDSNATADETNAAASARTRAEAIRDRIGFDPTPRNS